MTRALVIKTYGDPQIAGAIVDGVSRAVTPLNDSEYAALRAELARLRARDDIRAYGDEKRFETACKALTVKYYTKPVGRARGAILGAWACLWMIVYGIGDYLIEMNKR